MESLPLPYKQLIFVCTNARKPGERISCAGEGRCGEKVLEKLKAFVKSNHLEKVARVAKSGCQEQCEIGPNLAVMPQNQFISHVTEQDVDQIIKTYLSSLISS